MLIGTCATCETLRSEVAYLREQVTTLQKVLAEVADPLVNARIAQAQRVRDAQPAEQSPPRQRISVAAVRRQADRPGGHPTPVPTETREDIERGFQVS